VTATPRSTGEGPVDDRSRRRADGPVRPTRERVLDLVFLGGVLLKGLDGLAELVGGFVLLVMTPGQLQGAVRGGFARELAEDPHDVLANLLLHGAAHLSTGTARFLAAYLLLHGVVKIVIVAALLRGSLRVYPWAIAALCAFLAFQVYELVVNPGVGVAVLTLVDALVIALTWREWRHGRTLRSTFPALGGVRSRHRCEDVR
jgi:uncharacterized membrane protein